MQTYDFDKGTRLLSHMAVRVSFLFTRSRKEMSCLRVSGRRDERMEFPSTQLKETKNINISEV